VPQSLPARPDPLQATTTRGFAAEHGCDTLRAKLLGDWEEVVVQIPATVNQRLVAGQPDGQLDSNPAACGCHHRPGDLSSRPSRCTCPAGDRERLAELGHLSSHPLPPGHTRPGFADPPVACRLRPVQPRQVPRTDQHGLPLRPSAPQRPGGPAPQRDERTRPYRGARRSAARPHGHHEAAPVRAQPHRAGESLRALINRGRSRLAASLLTLGDPNSGISVLLV